MELRGLEPRLDVVCVIEAQDALKEMNPRAREGAFGDSVEHRNGLSFTPTVLAKALRERLPDHYITCRKWKANQPFGAYIAAEVQKHHTKRGSRLYLVDGTLNSHWFDGYDKTDCVHDSQEWRHMVLLSEKTGLFYEWQGNEALTYRIVDKSANNRDPTLCDKTGRIRPHGIVYGCPYFKCIHKVYEIDFIEKNPAAATK